MDSSGALVEDWGKVSFEITGEGLDQASRAQVSPVRLEGGVPGARVVRKLGGVEATVTAFRAPAWPSGFDVMTLQLREDAGRETRLKVSVALPEGVSVGARSASMGGRTLLALPAAASVPRIEREWGCDGEAAPMPGWAKPQGDCDAGFRNIRAGMGGVPIRYRFTVPAGSARKVVLGFCESHWATSGQRLVVCRVEGAPEQRADLIARWGQHKPGALVFDGRDANGDGKLDVVVLPDPAALDRNPILNVLWIFRPDEPISLDQVIAGKMNSIAEKYVDVGGPNDQSLYPAGRLDLDVLLQPKGTYEVTLYAASAGGSAPLPGVTPWTPESLLRAAAEVWRDWEPSRG